MSAPAAERTPLWRMSGIQLLLEAGALLNSIAFFAAMPFASLYLSDHTQPEQARHRRRRRGGLPDHRVRRVRRRGSGRPDRRHPADADRPAARRDRLRAARHGAQRRRDRAADRAAGPGPADGGPGGQEAAVAGDGRPRARLPCPVHDTVRGRDRRAGDRRCPLSRQPGRVLRCPRVLLRGLHGADRQPQPPARPRWRPGPRKRPRPEAR